MGILSTLESRSVAALDDKWYAPVPMPTAAGVEVDQHTALGHAAFWNGLIILTSAMGALPLKLYRSTGNRREPARDHPLFDMIHRRPNPWQTAFEFREMLRGHQLTRGNAYAQKVYDRMGRLVQLVPLHPARMEVKVEDEGLVYEFKRQDGTLRRFKPEEVHHIRAFSDGLIGYSVIHVARQSLGLGLAADRHGAKFFGNHARPGGILSTEGKLDKEQRDRIKSSWDASQGGDNTGSVAVLEGGLNWTSVGFNPQDSQFLETRAFEVVQVARWLNLPPHKLKELTRSTHNNIEHQNIEFVVDSIAPEAERWEQRYDLDFLSEDERRAGYYFKFSLDALLRGDSAARGEFYNNLFQIGAISPNEVREKEEMNPYEGGDTRFVQVNMMPVDVAAKMQPGSVEGPTPPADRALPETRQGPTPEERSIALRTRYHQSYRGIFEDAASRIVSRETKAIGRAITAELTSRGIPELILRLEDYWADHSDYVRSQFLPLLMSYMGVIGAAAAEEIDAEFDLDIRSTAFVGVYADKLAAGYVSSSRGQIEGIIASAAAADMADELRQRLAEWDEKRAGKIGMRESVQAGGAFARYVYDRHGRRAVWRTVGETCPYCNRLNGMTVNAGQTFLPEGAEVEGAEGDAPIRVRTGISHPQLHRDCDCVVAAA